MAKAKSELVIVESPAKARTIEKYLGGDYRVVASMGHLRDLPTNTLGVDLEHDFTPHYQPVKGREDVIDDLRKSAKNAKNVYLATDPDREGEAISWHLKELLDLPDDKARRVTFNEITKKVVQDSIQHPRAIDQDLVDAQQARRVLDRIVGYKLSPLLWRKIRKGLSAGRVQSVATRMVIDREREIREFVPEEYWYLFATLEADKGSFRAIYHGIGEKKQDLHSEAEVDAVAKAVEGKPFTIQSVKHGKKQRSPSPPFITSTLQQEASRRLGMTPRRTMSIAQQLYEGVDIEGEGTVGLITYMRTDSLRLSEDALAAAGSFIRAHYGEDYYYGKPRRFKTDSNAQDAHEAIRPSLPELTPDRVRKSLTGEQYRLYRLIWGRFTASQMANAVYDNVTVDAVCEGYTFRANHSEIAFPGYTAVYKDDEDDADSDAGKGKKPLPELREGESAALKKLEREQNFTTPPSRYSEATLIRAMEEKGIGRPSTYAPTISTITAREYVVKEGKYLRPTPLGETVNGLMEERFPDIVDVKFTARMEDSLDKVEEGKEDWKHILHDFYDGFETSLENAEEALQGVHLKVPDEVSGEICPNCGRNLVYKSGRFGRFLACPGYPECSFTMPIVVEMPGKCPRCGGRILKRTSKNGHAYYVCENRPLSEKRAAEAGERVCDFWTFDVPVKDDCPVCGKTMFKVSGKGQRKPFCINPDCEKFVPEDKRGYRPRKKADAAKSDAGTGEKPKARRGRPKKEAKS